MSILFCHIPKTAGTSFRKELERVLPDGTLLCDYGAGNPTTSESLQQRAAQPTDKRDWQVLCGHFSLDRYGSRFAPWQLATFVRHPLEQVISHWEHRKRVQGYEGTLEEFALSASGAGQQSRMLNGLPIQLLGFVGVTNQYESSLSLFRDLYRIDAQPQQLNVNPERAESSYDRKKYRLPAACRNRERADYDLFIQANRLLKARLDFRQQQAAQSWVHGAITRLDAQHVEGVAFTRDSTPHLPLQVLVNGQHAGFCCTGETPASLPALKLPERCGFRLPFSQRLSARDRVEIRALPHGQWLDTLDWHPGSKEHPTTPPPPGALDVSLRGGAIGDR